MKPKTPKEPPVVPMTCPVCTSCYRAPLAVACHFGGPFTGYAKVG